jgi:hypothetical protein
MEGPVEFSVLGVSTDHGRVRLVPQAALVPSTTSKVRTNVTDRCGENSTHHLKGLGTPIQEIAPLPKIELTAMDIRTVAGRTARQQTLLPGRD